MGTGRASSLGVKTGGSEAEPVFNVCGFAMLELSRPNPAFWPPVLLEVWAHVRRGGVQSPSGSRVYLPEPVPFPGTASPLGPGIRPGWHLVKTPGWGMPCLLLSAPARARPSLSTLPTWPRLLQCQAELSQQRPPSPGHQAQEGHLSFQASGSPPGLEQRPQGLALLGTPAGAPMRSWLAHSPPRFQPRARVQALWVRVACPRGPSPALEHSQGSL